MKETGRAWGAGHGTTWSTKSKFFKLMKGYGTFLGTQPSNYNPHENIPALVLRVVLTCNGK